MSHQHSQDPPQSAYDRVAEEIARGTYKPGLQARAIAECEGIETKSKARYIQLRAIEIVAEERESAQKEASNYKTANKAKRRDDLLKKFVVGVGAAIVCWIASKYWDIQADRAKIQMVDKAVLSNARHLAAGSDQYFLENGVSFVTWGNLVGVTNYIRSINVVANETYPVAFTQKVPITVAGIAGQRTITYAP